MPVGGRTYCKDVYIHLTSDKRISNTDANNMSMLEAIQAMFQIQSETIDQRPRDMLEAMEKGAAGNTNNMWGCRTMHLYGSRTNSRYLNKQEIRIAKVEESMSLNIKAEVKDNILFKLNS